jgi:hypothetical protein
MTASTATFITDLAHLVDENGLPPVGAPKELLEALGFYGGIVEAGSSHPVGTQFPSAIPCRKDPTKSRLTIANRRDGTILWKCPDCDENGSISNWQGSDYDLSGATEPDMGRRVGVHVTAEAHGALREIITNSQEEQAIIAGAVVTSEGIWISGRVDDFEELLGSIAAAANHAKNAKRRRVLHGVFDKVERIVAESVLG